jgi:hypothetical protein
VFFLYKKRFAHTGLVVEGGRDVDLRRSPLQGLDAVAGNNDVQAAGRKDFTETLGMAKQKACNPIFF